MAMLTLIMLPLTTRTELLAEDQEKAKEEERQWGEEVNGCRISIKLKDYDEKEHGPVTLSIIVRNTGKEILKYPHGTACRMFALSVKDDKGEAVPLTRFTKSMIYSGGIYNFLIMELAPGEQKEYSHIADKMYDMTLPGTYKVTVTLYIRDAENKEQIPVKSNTITVIVRD
jgi:hypothetical protein